MSTFVAVDIGGTHIRAAAYESNNPHPLTHQRTRSQTSKPGLYDRLETLVESAWPAGHAVQAIGVASPGPLDPQAGVILATPNIREWRDFPLSEKLAGRFGVPVYLQNDANMAALGEWKFGAGRGHHNVLYLTISTGIGGGVIVDDRLLQGHHGLAAELGHVTVLADGPLCPCGQPGHIEALSSGPAIVQYVLERLEAGEASALRGRENLNAHEVAIAAQAGDALATSAYTRAGEYLGIAVASYLHAFDPSIVIFGGGVSRSGALLFVPFHESLRRHVFNPRYLENLTITTAALGDDAGLLGALALAQMGQSSDI